VLEHIEQRDDLELHGERRKRGVSPDKQWGIKSALGVLEAFLVKVHSEDRAAGRTHLEGTQDVSSPAADLEHAVSGSQALADGLEDGRDGAIARPKPEMVFLDGDEALVNARVVAGAGIDRIGRRDGG
jgi:hypothetical protein